MDTAEMVETARMLSELAAIPDVLRGLNDTAKDELTRNREATASKQAEFAAIQSKRGSYADATGPGWLPPNEEACLAQLQRDLSQLSSENTTIYQQLPLKLAQAEKSRALLEERLYPRTKEYFTQKRLVDEAALQHALTDAKNGIAHLDEPACNYALALACYRTGPRVLRCKASRAL